ncbi:hypothetical protein NQ318_006563 [Aromia moschata]|uniref:MI domain-containing protein n=1 Tax=Aromia moschata TaxID=1265417 RepID=A0AAV8YQC0_9CUCU|nr:hypothetical protein NQ318_006563 [Aromia moschata]
MASDRGGVDVKIDENDIDIDKVVNEELAAKENATAPDALAKYRRPKKVHRQNSKESVVASGFVHGPRSWKNSRRSRNGYGRGLPKKGGAGGKGVWGAPGSELLETYEDVDDPNFDSETLSNGDIELKAVFLEVSDEDVKKKEEQIPVSRRDALVEQLIEIAMDHKPSHREMTSVLISDLFPHIINESDISKAFENLLANLNDLILDIPDAPTVLGNFIARAIADDCIPPKFIVIMKEKSDNKDFQEALIHADTLLSMKHGLVRLHNVWGVGGALRPVKALTRQMSLLLQEFISSGDIEEASRCLRLLEVPHFHHELVYEAIVMALEANSAVKEEALCNLLKAFADAVLITLDQIEPYIILDRFVEKCHKDGFLTETILKRLPSRGRKRFVSEGDQQFIKSHKIEH